MRVEDAWFLFAASQWLNTRPRWTVAPSAVRWAADCNSAYARSFDLIRSREGW